MTATTREIVQDTMTREWEMVWAGVPNLRPTEYLVEGTALYAVQDFQQRFPFIPVRASKIIMEDGVWTIRITFCNGSTATVFAS